MRYQRQEMEAAYQQLVLQEKPVLALIGALIGILPGLLTVELFADYFFLNMIVAAVVFPGIIALFARFVGRCFSVSARAPLGMVICAVYLGTGFLIQATPMWFMVAPVPFGIGFVVSRRGLSALQKFAVFEHQIRPFDVKESHFLVKALAPIILLVLSSAGGYWFWHNTKNLCMDSIKADNHSDVLQFCGSGEQLTLESWSQQSSTGFFIHSFGSYFSQTDEAQQVYSKAEAGELFYQRLWWIILEQLYKKDLYRISEQSVERYLKDVKHWRLIVIEKHFPAALQIQIAEYKAAPLSTDEQRQSAIDTAQKLIDTGVYGADKLLEAALGMVTEKHILDRFHQQLAQLDELNLIEAEDLLWAVEQGEYYYNLDEVKGNHSYGLYPRPDYISVPKKPEKVIEILTVLSHNLEHAKSSYRLYNHYNGKDKEEAMWFLKLASDQGHLDAMSELGIRLYCKDDFQGRLLINKAAEQGHELSILRRKDIAENKKLSVCGLLKASRL